MKRYWFTSKRYGYGWTPATWKGWSISVGYIFIIILTAHYILGENPTTQNIYETASIIVITTLIFLGICYKTGETPRWRWGGK
jgi:hypothetical protein